jgi:hypothetical protein
MTKAFFDENLKQTDFLFALEIEKRGKNCLR